LQETLNALLELFWDAKSQSRQHPKGGTQNSKSDVTLRTRAAHDITEHLIVSPNTLRDSPEVGGTTGFAIPLRAPWGIWDASAAMGFMKVPCAVAAAIKAACCCKPSHWKSNETQFNIATKNESFKG
jgi:hypothetical protein